jgi:hypothetical protein
MVTSSLHCGEEIAFRVLNGESKFISNTDNQTLELVPDGQFNLINWCLEKYTPDFLWQEINDAHHITRDICNVQFPKQAKNIFEDFDKSLDMFIKYREQISFILNQYNVNKDDLKIMTLKQISDVLLTTIELMNDVTDDINFKDFNMGKDNIESYIDNFIELKEIAKRTIPRYNNNISDGFILPNGLVCGVPSPDNALDHQLTGDYLCQVFNKKPEWITKEAIQVRNYNEITGRGDGKLSPQQYEILCIIAKKQKNIINYYNKNLGASEIKKMQLKDVSEFLSF